MLYDAEGYSSVLNFKVVQENTECIYAAKSRIWGAPDWRPELSLAANLDAIIPHLLHFLDLARPLKLDGYVVEMLGPDYGDTIEHLARTTRLVLNYLSERDPAGEHCMAKEIEDPSWCFAFGGEKIFINTFGSCYDSHNSRFSFGALNTFILFQPRHSFAQAIRPGESTLPAAARSRIRTDYRKHGRPYDAQISASPFDAYRYVRPLKHGDPTVRWWET